jgi:hypothetical protein
LCKVIQRSPCVHNARIWHLHNRAVKPYRFGHPRHCAPAAALMVRNDNAAMSMLRQLRYLHGMASWPRPILRRTCSPCCNALLLLTRLFPRRASPSPNVPSLRKWIMIWICPSHILGTISQFLRNRLSIVVRHKGVSGVNSR